MKKNRSNAEHYVWGQECDGWRLLDRADLSVIQERIPPGGGEVRHHHERARQLFFVVSGELVIDIAADTVHLGVGDSVEVVPGASHQVRNASTEEVVFIVVSAPSTRGDRTELGG